MSGLPYHLRRAIVSALTSDASVQALVGNPARVFTFPFPPGLTYPAIGLESPDVEEPLEAGNVVERAEFRLHSFTRGDDARSDDTADQMAEAIRARLMDGAALVITGHAVSYRPRRVYSEAITEADQVTKRRICRYRIITTRTI